MEYREIKTAPKEERVKVVWGEKCQKPEYGIALRFGNQWYIYGQSNPHANGRPCAVPDGWLPENRAELTKAEKGICNVLAPHLEIARAACA